MNRRQTREVRIGAVAIGADHPIAIQSMTTADTNDVNASTEEAARIAAAGAEIVRLTVPSLSAAEALRQIHSRLRERGIDVPLVADIHYTPNAALLAAEIVEKVRINPGNFADRRERLRAGEGFADGAARVAELFGPLVEKLKARGGALRIGVNHGSLSERMTARYGDTPEGMVRSAIEYIEVCERLGFRSVVVSLKSSIPAVTVRANRLFARIVDERGGRYPLHVGVTEAGMGGEGRIRSAAGIGALLAEGIGDTIRVSLTEDPVKEVPAARAILAAATRVLGARLGPPAEVSDGRPVMSLPMGGVFVGGAQPVAVVADDAGAAEAGEPPDFVVTGCGDSRGVSPGASPVIVKTDTPDRLSFDEGASPAGALFSFPCEGISWERADRSLSDAGIRPVVTLRTSGPAEIAAILDELRRAMPRSSAEGMVVAPAGGEQADLLPALERALSDRALPWPLLVAPGGEGEVLRAVVSLAPPLLDGLGHLLYLPGPGGARKAWDILQGTRRRITRVEYISCPSCGRTLFDLEEVTARIQERTSHLKDVRIAVMGCIVNGPGEMADADFGYVGSGPGKIDLYVGRERVAKSIAEAEAVERLVDLIKKRGRWLQP